MTPAVSPLNCWTTYKDIANSVSKIEGILSTPIWQTEGPLKTAGPLKVGVSLWSQNVPAPQTLIYMSNTQ